MCRLQGLGGGVKGPRTKASLEINMAYTVSTEYKVGYIRRFSPCHDIPNSSVIYIPGKTI